MYQFKRFTRQAKQVVIVAQAEAERPHHHYISTGHLLIGLLQVEGSTAARILTDLGIEIGRVRDTIERAPGWNEQVVIRRMDRSWPAMRVVDIAFEEARLLGPGQIGTHHLLLGLLLEGQGLAARTLADLGVTENSVREAIVRLEVSGMMEDAPPGHGGAPIWMPRGITASPPGPDPRQLVEGLDDLTAAEVLAALRDRFGATPPPPRLLQLAAAVRKVDQEFQAAAEKQDYEAAGGHHKEQRRRRTELAAELANWRQRRAELAEP